MEIIIFKINKKHIIYEKIILIIKKQNEYLYKQLKHTYKKDKFLVILIN